MITFVKGRRYLIVSKAWGLAVGAFDRTFGPCHYFTKLQTLDDLAQSSKLAVPKEELVDAEPWMQSIPLRDYTMTKNAELRRKELTGSKGRKIGG